MAANQGATDFANQPRRMKTDLRIKKLNPEELSLLTYAALTPLLVSIDILIAVSALSVVNTLELLEKMVRAGILEKNRNFPLGVYRFANIETADSVLRTLEGSQLTSAAERMIPVIEEKYEEGQEKDRALARLYTLTASATLSFEHALKAANYLKETKLLKEAAHYYKIILNNPPASPLKKEYKRMVIEATLGLVEVQGSSVPLPFQGAYLKKARNFARQLQISEMLARINLIYARTLTRNSGEMTKTAQLLIKEACGVAHRTGNNHLIRKTEIAKCVFLLWGGQVSDAIKRWESAVGHLDDLSFYDEDDLHYYAALGWAYGICGQTARGIGLCEAALQKAIKMKNHELQCYINMMAGMILFEARRFSEGTEYFKRILSFPEDEPGGFPLRNMHLALAFINYQDGRYEEAFDHLNKGFDYSHRFGWFHHRTPWIFECIEALEQKGYVVQGHHYEEELKLILEWPDKYMNGVALQLCAQRKMKNGESNDSVLSDLVRSRQLLLESGGRIELARTLILLAYFYLQDQKKSEAIEAAEEAREILSTVNTNIFPKDLEHLIAKAKPESLLLGTMIKVGNALGTVRNRTELLKRITTLIMQLTLAERGGVFLQKKDASILDLAASANLDAGAIDDKSFHHSHQIIKQVAASGKGIMLEAREDRHPEIFNISGLAWVICSPLLIQSRVLGVFYLDSSHALRGLQEKGLELIEAIGIQVAIALENVAAYEQIALLRDRLENESRFFQMEVAQIRHFDQIIGNSDAIKVIQAQMQKVAPTDSAVLIEGETGVGKELVARGIHRMSKRANGPFISINTGALSPGLVASELFGHERGAFTGAVQKHPGRFSLADGGTIFLDDIQNLSLEIQAKLLRAIQEKKFERVGGTKTIESDFRIIAASNQPLKAMVEKGEFRSDLYYRLNVFPIQIPPLRERREDIPMLCLHFLELFKRKIGKNVLRISKKDMEWLVGYQWPGNVRELEHIIERAVILSDGEALNLSDTTSKKKIPLIQASESGMTLLEYEKSFIIKTLKECGWRVSGEYGAARMLNVKATTLFAKMKRLGIARKKGLPKDNQELNVSRIE